MVSPDFSLLDRQTVHVDAGAARDPSSYGARPWASGASTPRPFRLPSWQGRVRCALG